MDQISQIIEDFGGVENILELECCSTRIRLHLKDEKKFNREHLLQEGALGIFDRGDEKQIVYGLQAATISKRIETRMDESVGVTINKGEKEEVIYSPLEGTIVPLEKVEDGVFSEKMLGDGVAILPEQDFVYAPFDGKISNVFETKHAITITSECGVEVLIHLGLDTVDLNGKYYDIVAQTGATVKQGQVIGSFDQEKIEKEGYSMITPVVVTMRSNFSQMEIVKNGKVGKDQKIITLKK